MAVGAKWRFYVPPDLGYGDQDRPPIPANSTLIFDVELLKIGSS
jgi:FKBP-type peptidyl-prolyl cis-trans isomerase FkpA